jgi:hypothetical protein
MSVLKSRPFFEIRYFQLEFTVDATVKRVIRFFLSIDYVVRLLFESGCVMSCLGNLTEKKPRLSIFEFPSDI